MNGLFSFGLLCHIIGITLIAGGSIGGLILEHRMWKAFRSNQFEEAGILGHSLHSFPGIIQIGTIIMLLSGLLMLGELGWQIAGQYWFIIKMVFVVALVLNGVLVARPNGQKLVILLSEPKNEMNEKHSDKFRTLHKKMNWFHISELGMLLLVYILAVYRF